MVASSVGFCFMLQYESITVRILQPPCTSNKQDKNTASSGVAAINKQLVLRSYRKMRLTPTIKAQSPCGALIL